MPPSDPSSADWFADFGVNRSNALAVLAAATRHGGDHADLFFEHATTTSLAMSDRKVNRAFTSVDLGVGVRVVVGDQVGYAYTEDLSLESMLRVARIASEIARGGKAVAPVPSSPRALPNRYPIARTWENVALSERIPLLQAWEERAFSLDPRVIKAELSLADTDRRVWIVCADGREASDYRPMTRAFVNCTVEDGAVRESGGYNLAARNDLSFYTAERQARLVDEAVLRAVRSLDATTPPAGEMPVVMAAGSSGILLHEAVGHGLEADFNRKGISVFADRIGQRVAPAGVTIVDDGTVPFSRGAINVDDEANDVERTVLINDGILTSYLHDNISAKHYGVSPTGSGRRESFRHPVLPRMRATYMEAGPYDPREIIASVERGIYCETFANGQVQIGAGDFAFYVRHGYLIEDGKLTRPVKDVNLIGNGPKVLEAIQMVGNDLVIDESGWTCGKDGQSVPVSQGMPTVKVAALSVGGGTR